MKTNVKFKMGAALMVMSLGFGLVGAVNTAQAKDVVLKEIPSKFVTAESCTTKGGTGLGVSLQRDGVLIGDPGGEVDGYIVSVAQTAKNKITVTQKFWYVDMESTKETRKNKAKAKTEKTVLELKGKKLYVDGSYCKP
jgi:hypothetical protein